MSGALTIYHGGVPGLEPGDELLPGVVTGINSARSIHVTLDRAEAIGQASRWPGGGDVYEVSVQHPTGPSIESLTALVIARPSIGWPPKLGQLSTLSATVERVVCRGVGGGMPRPELANRKPIKKRRRANA